MKNILMITGLLILFSCSLFADVIIDEDVGYRIEVPDLWESFEDESVIMVMDPDEMAAVFLMPVLSKDFDDTVAEMEATVGELIEDLEIAEETDDIEINGLPGMMVFGSGNIEEEPVIWGIVIVYIEETDFALFVITFALAEAYEEYEYILLEILSSVAPADAGYDEEECDGGYDEDCDEGG